MKIQQILFIENGQSYFGVPDSPIALYRQYVLRLVADAALQHWPVDSAVSTVDSASQWMAIGLFATDSVDALYLQLNGDRSLEVCLSIDCGDYACEVKVVDGVLSFCLEDWLPDNQIEAAKELVITIYQSLMAGLGLQCLEAVICGSKAVAALPK